MKKKILSASEAPFASMGTPSNTVNDPALNEVGVGFAESEKVIKFVPSEREKLSGQAANGEANTKTIIPVAKPRNRRKFKCLYLERAQ